jgi:Protein of unknown function (DUF3429)
MWTGGHGEGGKSKLADRLAMAGFIPFALCLIWLLGTGPSEPNWHLALAAMRGYAIAILSFLGGVRWGAALYGETGARTFWHSVVPPLLAWSTVFMSPVTALAILAMTFAGQGAWDVLSAQSGTLPGWYGGIRMKLTFMVTAVLLIAMFRVGQPVL